MASWQINIGPSEIFNEIVIEFRLHKLTKVHHIAIMSEVDQPVTGVDSNDPPKTAKQLEKEAKKAAKLQKLQEKLDKKATVVPSGKDKPEVSSVWGLLCKLMKLIAAKIIN